MTYDEFIQVVTDLQIRGDAPLESLIRRSESYLRVVTSHVLSEKSVVLPVVDSRVELPADLLEIRLVSGSKLYKPVAPQAARLCEEEIGYYREGNSLVLVGEPEAEVSLLYKFAFADLTEDQTNWLFDRFPNVYIAAVMKSFEQWQRNSEGVAIEDAALREALGVVELDDKRARQTGPIIMGGSTWR